MILCVTPNPAIDRTLILPSLILGEVHRAERVIVAAGGKGLNVARTIHALDGKPLCLGFAGGLSGHLLAELARREGLNSFWTRIDSETRTCTIVVTQTGDATVINEPGMPVTKSDWKRLESDIKRHASPADLVCVSGSLPPGSSVDDLQGLLGILIDAGKKVWVDTSGAALDAVLFYPGICVKVNGDEISRSLGFEVKDVSSAKRALTLLGERGLATSLITLGAAGALLATNEGRWHAQGPRVPILSTVGSGGHFSLQDFMDFKEQVHIHSW